MKLGIPSAIGHGETRVALVPEVLAKLKKINIDVVVERGAGEAAGFPDSTFESAGATLVDGAAAVCEQSNLIVSIRPPTPELLDHVRTETILIAMCNPLVRHDLVKDLASRGLTAFALELVPRITRAQAMDVLSSMSSLAGYKAVLVGASELVRIFPMMMTAAGTLKPARALILGAGVAGLQAIATARRLGAIVEAFDVRPVVKEQVESLGAKFVVVDAPQEDAQDKGGYAKEMSAAYQQRQREVIAQHVKDNDVVICTALIPGKPAPRLITADMVPHMRPGSVIVDLAAEAGGNCELCKANERVQVHGVTILGPTNLPATVPFHASQAFARNVTSFLQNMVKDGALSMNMEDEIIRDSLVSRGGDVVNPRLRQMLGLPPITQSSEQSQAVGATA